MNAPSLVDTMVHHVVPLSVNQSVNNVYVTWLVSSHCVLKNVLTIVIILMQISLVLTVVKPACNKRHASFTTETIYYDDKKKKPGKGHDDYGYAYSAQLESWDLAEAASEAAAYAAMPALDVDQTIAEFASGSSSGEYVSAEYDYLSEFAAIYDGYSAAYGYQGEYISAVYNGFNGGGEYPYGYPYDGGAEEGGYGYEYAYNPYGAYDPRYPPPPSPSKEYQDHDHYVGDDDYFEGLFIGGPDFTNNRQKQHECPTCTKTVTDVDISISFVTTTRSADDIICAQYIIPCPVEYPYSCVYPMDQPCPYTEQPWCPSAYDNEGGPSCIYNTEGYPFPYFPPYDPYHSIFTSILNESGVTFIPAFVTEITTSLPVHYCPLIFRLW